MWQGSRPGCGCACPSALDPDHRADEGLRHLPDRGPGHRGQEVTNSRRVRASPQAPGHGARSSPALRLRPCLAPAGERAGISFSIASCPPDTRGSAAGQHLTAHPASWPPRIPAGTLSRPGRALAQDPVQILVTGLLAAVFGKLDGLTRFPALLYRHPRPRWHKTHPGGKGPARDISATRTAMKWLRECFAEYARHPLPTFIGVAIIGASLITAAMAFITRHPASEPSAPLAGSAPSVTPAAPSTRTPRPSRPPERPSPAPPPVPAAQQGTTAPQIRAAVRRHPRVQDRMHPQPQQRRPVPHPHGPHPHGRNDQAPPPLATEAGS